MFDVTDKNNIGKEYNGFILLGIDELADYKTQAVFLRHKKTGLEIDYVFCDIEHVHADANSISKNRFNETFRMLLGFDKTKEMWKKVYDGNIWNG